MKLVLLLSFLSMARADSLKDMIAFGANLSGGTSTWVATAMALKADTYSYTVCDWQAGQSVVTTGVYQRVGTADGLSWGMLAAVGAAQSASSTKVAYTGGILFTYDLSKVIKKATNVYILGGVRPIKGTTGTKMKYEIGIGRGF